jgi:hypothetical protein
MGQKEITVSPMLSEGKSPEKTGFYFRIRRANFSKIKPHPLHTLHNLYSLVTWRMKTKFQKINIYFTLAILQ